MEARLSALEEAAGATTAGGSAAGRSTQGGSPYKRRRADISIIDIKNYVKSWKNKKREETSALQQAANEYLEKVVDGIGGLKELVDLEKCKKTIDSKAYIPILSIFLKAPSTSDARKVRNAKEEFITERGAQAHQWDNGYSSGGHSCRYEALDALGGQGLRAHGICGHL